MEIHARLRRETACDHRRIEASLDILKPTFSLAEYRCLLLAFYGFYHPLERRLREVAASAPDVESMILPSRSALLARDLSALGVAQKDIADVRCCNRLPSVSSVAHIAGCVYVLEGAALGGQIIARALARSLGVSRNHGASFFVGAAAATGAGWKRTLRWLDDVVHAGADPEAVVSSARATFRAFHEWLACCREHAR
jgi:heme oxygenase (biliverdin-IX-beta and delta-forming)